MGILVRVPGENLGREEEINFSKPKYTRSERTMAHSSNFSRVY